MKAEAESRRSFLNYIIALAAIFALNFVLPRLMPGDPLHAIYGDEALVAMTPEMERSLIREFALDRSWIDQLQAYITGLLHGDLGFSYYYKDQVSSVIMGALPWTLLLAGLALVIATALGIILGIESGYKRGRSRRTRRLRLSSGLGRTSGPSFGLSGPSSAGRSLSFDEKHHRHHPGRVLHSGCQS